MGRHQELVDVLQTAHHVGFDTPLFIYHIEASSRRAAVAHAVLRAMANGQFLGLTSVLTLLELTTKPLRLGRPEVADAYEVLLRELPNLAIIDLDARVARIGAEIRATYGLRTPDSLQIAACVVHGANAFVTTDRRLRRVRELEVVVLGDFA